MAEIRKYNFLRGSSGHHGSVFQIKLLTLCLLKGLKRGTDFELSSENQKDAGMFDDVIYEEDETGSVLMQAKHKQDGRGKIKIKELFDNDSEFQLGQYLSSFCNIKGFTEILKVRLLTNIAITSGTETDNFFESIVIDRGDILYCTEKIKGYALTEKSRGRLRTQPPSVSEDDLSRFLEQFQLICIPDTELDKAIEGILGDFELFDERIHERVATASYIRGKVEQWYIKGSGEYLRKLDAKAYLCMWRSINHAQTLQNFNISFRRRNINSGNRLVYIVDRKFYPLGLIKVYQQFVEENNKGDAVMIVNPEDSLSIQENMVEAFAIPECLLLIVPLYEDNLYGDLRMEELLQNISNRTYKKVVFFAGKDSFSEHVPNAQVISLRIRFDDLEETCKNAFLEATVDFQGNDVCLKDVLTPNGDANDIIDEETLLMLSRGEQIKIEKVQDQEDIGSIYIDRWFIRDDNRYSEKDICDLVMTESDEKFVLISDGAGMGKTTVLTKITEILQDPLYSHRWIIRLDLNRYANSLRDLRHAGKESIEVQDILDSTGKVLRSNFQKKLFNIPASVILITDAVDEVSAAYTPMILKLFENSFARTNIAKIIVTTRPQLENVLERQLNVCSFKLELFSPQNQIEFLTQYWATNLELRLEEDISRCELYAKSLMEKLNRSIGHASWSFIGIPLQTKMVADIFQQGSGQHSFKWQGCREFLRSQRADVELNVDINVAKLYEMFVTKKGDIYVERRNPQGTTEDILNRHYRRAIEVHKRLAIQSLMDPEKWQLFGVYRDANVLDEDGLSDMGIVHDIEGTWIFSHQTFGEYFAAICLWDELTRANCEYLQFLLGHVLVSSDFSVVRSFFENILANETVSEGVLNKCGSAIGLISWNESRNIVRLAEEGRLHTLKLLLERSSNYSYLLQIKDIRGFTAFHSATKYLPVMQYLFTKGAKVDETTLHEAVLNNCADAVTFLIAKCEKIDVKLGGRTPLHLAAKRDFCDVAELLINANADLEATDSNLKTPLHVAAENKAVRVAELLIEAGADVNAKTSNGQTALDLARWNNCSEVVVGLQFDRKTIPMNKLVATTLESKIYCFDVRTQHPRKGFACLTEKAHDSTVWAVRHLPQNREIFMTTGGAGSMCLWKYNYPTKRIEKDSDGIPYGVVGDLSLLQNCTLSDQPITAFDWCVDKTGLSVCSAFDQTLRVLITTKLNLY